MSKYRLIRITNSMYSRLYECMLCDIHYRDAQVMLMEVSDMLISATYTFKSKDLSGTALYLSPLEPEGSNAQVIA